MNKALSSCVIVAFLTGMFVQAARASIPVTFTLDKPGFVTLVVEDKSGDRVCNLVADTYFAAGKHTVLWDGYDVGANDSKGALLRHRVKPGSYRVRGLVHDHIGLRYEMTVDSPGAPPWRTPDGAGGWLADRTPPADILFLPDGIEPPNKRGKARFLVCSMAADAGDTFAWLDENGRKLCGINTGPWGGVVLCRDIGAQPAPGDEAYVLTSGELTPDNRTVEIRALRPGGKLETVYKMELPSAAQPFVRAEGAYDTQAEDEIPPIAAGYGANGMAARNGMLVFSVTQLNRLYFVDAAARRLIGEQEVRSPRGLLFDKEGRLLVISGRQVKRFGILSGSPRLIDETTLIDKGLEDPRRIALDSDGLLYVADWGRKHQIEVYSPKLRLIRTIGKEGGQQLGHYDERRMSYPCGMALDHAGRLWVAEAEYGPKRISLWKQDGSFIRGFYGPPQYGGGGTLDPEDRTIFYYASGRTGVEFKLDWGAGSYKPSSIYWRPGQKDVEGMPGPAPERCYVVEERRFLVNCFNGDGPQFRHRGAGIWRMGNDGIARPVAIAGCAADLMARPDQWGEPLKQQSQIAQQWRGPDPATVLFVWCDKNGDRVAQPDEVQFRTPARTDPFGQSSPAHGLTPMVLPDLSITTDSGLWIAAPGLDGRDTPIYNVTRVHSVGRQDPPSPPLVADRWCLTEVPGPDGTLAYMGCDASGKAAWRFNASAGSLDPNATAAPLIRPRRLLGPPVIPRSGHAGPLVAINGERGAIYLLTMDGLFLQTLGGDPNTLPPLHAGDLSRGALTRDFSFGLDNQRPTLNQLSNGDIYVVAGCEHSSLFKLEGLKSVRRKDFGTIKVSQADVADLPADRVETAAAR